MCDDSLFLLFPLFVSLSKFQSYDKHDHQRMIPGFSFQLQHLNFSTGFWSVLTLGSTDSITVKNFAIGKKKKQHHPLTLPHGCDHGWNHDMPHPRRDSILWSVAYTFYHSSTVSD
jgi:hypothetical protein